MTAAHVHSTLALALMRAHPREAARLLAQQPREQAAWMLNRAAPAVVAGVLNQIGVAVAADLLQRLEPRLTQAVLGGLRVPEAARLLRAMPAPERQAHLDRLAGTTRASLVVLLYYPAHRVGAIMDPAVRELRPELPAESALRELRLQPLGDGHHLYVTDEQHRLLGALRLEDLVRAPRTAHLDVLMRHPVPALNPRLGLGETLNLPVWREWDALPVTETDGTLVGSLAFVDLHRAAELIGAETVTTWWQEGEALVDHLAGALGDLVHGLLGNPEKRDALRGGR